MTHSASDSSDLRISRSRITGVVNSTTGSLIRTALSSGQWLRRAVWAWPVIAAVILGIFGLILRYTIENRIQADMSSRMETILHAEVEALRFWVRGQEKAAATLASEADVLDSTRKLIEATVEADPSQLGLLQSSALERLRAELSPYCEKSGYQGWVIVSPEQQFIASARNDNIGLPVPVLDRSYTEQALQGKTTVSPPRKSAVLLKDDDGEMRAGVPTMFVWAPIGDAGEHVIAALGLRIPPQHEFTEILSIARPGKTGDTYAVASDGRLISQSRFDEELRQIGLLREDERSILNLTIRDPAADLVAGERSSISRSEQPLTVAAADVVAGHSGSNMKGYRDYRGVPVVGSWIWLPEYSVGVITEQDVSEAFAVLDILRLVFWTMFGLLGAAAVAIFGFMVSLERKQQEARQASLEARRLGQYSLDEKLGEGGMGVVYRGHHAMLHRPTAIKLLNVDKTNEQTIARFEREVKQTARLSHPNTIVIYDYGRTPEDVFYYAMECLEGINLENLVKGYGPLPECRVVHILRQICGSLSEAHGIGLIHRDVKPANIYLTVRGGIYDFVKLLDFGLVKVIDETAQARLTSANGMTGTPLYMAPEVIENPDAASPLSDLYAVGAVAYYLLTGSPVFDGRTVLQILQQHINGGVETPSARTGQAFTPSLEALILKCLSKVPAERPQSADELEQLLAACELRSSWSRHEATAWWSTNSGESRPSSSKASSAVSPSAVEETIIASVAPFDPEHPDNM